jgi:membrane fusion protein (multidrug efflux system)
MRVFSIELVIAIVPVLLALSGCQESRATVENQTEHHEIVVTTPLVKDVVTTDQYVCQIHGRQNIEVCALSGGYLQNILVQEGQSVKAGDLLFQILPVVYQARLTANKAEVQQLEIKLHNAKTLLQKGIVSAQEVAIFEAKLEQAQGNLAEAQAKAEFTSIKARFDGIVGQRMKMKGSLVEEGDVLTTLTDDSVMWVYFNVPETQYLKYIHRLDPKDRENYEEYLKKLPIELILANGEQFAQPGKITAIESNFNNTTGTIKFRADFPNPQGILRQGQTGKVLVHHVLNDALVIPQRSTYEILAHRYVDVIDGQDIAHQRLIEVKAELEDIYVVGQGLKANERIVFEGIRFVRDGSKTEYQFRKPQDILNHLKYYAN